MHCCRKSCFLLQLHGFLVLFLFLLLLLFFGFFIIIIFNLLFDFLVSFAFLLNSWPKQMIQWIFLFLLFSKLELLFAIVHWLSLNISLYIEVQFIYHIVLFLNLFLLYLNAKIFKCFSPIQTFAHFLLSFLFLFVCPLLKLYC